MTRRWEARGRLIVDDAVPKVMGIVNVTPDSFSDGGKWFSTDEAVAHGLKLVQDGADVLDVGGESTRPGAEIVSVDDEIQRVVPVVGRLAAETDVPISIDTTKPEVARAPCSPALRSSTTSRPCANPGWPRWCPAPTRGWC